jgi:hypothetical protein
MDDEESPESDVPHDGAASAAAGREGLAAQLRQLEAFAARSVSAGEELPPQVVEMIARLREIVQALDGLTASMAHEPGAVDLGDTDARPADTDRLA